MSLFADKVLLASILVYNVFVCNLLSYTPSLYIQCIIIIRTLVEAPCRDGGGQISY